MSEKSTKGQRIMGAMLSINGRHNALAQVLEYFIENGADNIFPTDTFNTCIVVCQPSPMPTETARKNARGLALSLKEILALVDHLIELCPKQDYFTLKRVCNCVYISAIPKFSEEE